MYEPCIVCRLKQQRSTQLGGQQSGPDAAPVPAGANATGRMLQCSIDGSSLRLDWLTFCRCRGGGGGGAGPRRGTANGARGGL